MKQLFADADHIVAAFINRNSEGFQDDREFGAGHRVLATLKEQNSMNIAVFVVRRFGGKQLGPSRHDYFKQVTLEALARLP